MTQCTKRVSVAKAAILQQTILPEDLIELLGDVGAFGAWSDELQTTAMYLTVDLPQADVFVRSMIKE